MKKIELKTGHVVLIDSDDYELVKNISWHMHPQGYAQGKIGRKNVLMHRMILQPPDGMDSDHINGNKLDNRRSNLRAVTRSLNAQNKPAYSGRKYKGVCFHKRAGRWVAYIKKDKKIRHLGCFTCEDEAARAYNKAAIELFGPLAKLNPVPQG
jgi:hypothetical protein